MQYLEKVPNEVLNIGDNQAQIRNLVEQLRSRVGVIPFVGAGLSIPFGFPGWTGFLREEGRKAYCEESVRSLISDGGYEEAAQLLYDKIRHRAFEDAINREFGRDAFKSKAEFGVLDLLPSIADGPVITTNFDRVLEHVYQKNRKPFERAVWGANPAFVSDAAQQGRRILIKIHGDFADETERVLTSRDYNQHYGGLDIKNINYDLPLPKMLMSILLSAPLLFIGCSLNYDRTVTMLGQIAVKYRGMKHYAIISRPPTDREFHDQKVFFSSHGLRPIWYPSDRHDMIAVLLQNLIAGKDDVIPLKPDGAVTIKSKTQAIEHLLSLLRTNKHLWDLSKPTEDELMNSESLSAVEKLRIIAFWFNRRRENMESFEVDIAAFERTLRSSLVSDSDVLESAIETLQAFQEECVRLAQLIALTQIKPPGARTPNFLRNDLESCVVFSRQLIEDLNLHLDNVYSDETGIEVKVLIHAQTTVFHLKKLVTEIQDWLNRLDEWLSFTRT